MKKALLIIFLPVCLLQHIKSQDHFPVNITFRDVPAINGSKIYLYLLNNYPGTQNLTDSAVVAGGNKITLQIPGDANPGLYTVLIYASVNGNSIQSNFNFLFDRKREDFNTCVKTPLDSIQVAGTDMNYSYFLFVNKKKFYSDYLRNLIALKRMTPPADSFYAALDNQERKISRGQSELFEQIRNNQSNNIADKYNRWLLASEIYSNELEKVEQLRMNFLKRFDFSDPVIKNLNLLTRITSAYLYLFKDGSLSFEQQEQKLIDAVDVMMTYYSVDEDIERYVATQLEQEFKNLGMEKAVIHIAEYYLLASSCLSRGAEDNLKGEIERLKNLQPGNKAPDFIIEKNGIKDLYGIKSDTVLVVFWATWCSHCQQAMPEIYQLLKENSSVEVVAVALDEDTDAWRKEIKKYPGWIHIQAENMWDGEVPLLYAVYATPTVYVLNSHFEIVKKIKNVSELRYLMK